MQPMALQRVALAAHHRDPLLSGDRQQAFDPIPELGRRHPAPIVHAGCRRRAGDRLTAQLGTEVMVADPVLGQQTLEPVLREVRHEARVGPRAHVGDRLDLVPAQQPEKPLERMVGVANREQQQGGRRSRSTGRPRV
jgi:hypothetical protein